MEDTAVREEILRRLKAFELEHDVEILFAIESGSRAWGFESPDSDYDIRFIYRHRPEWYQALYFDRERDVIGPEITGDLDFSGWDVRKALRLFANSNPSFVEWAQSPITYIDDGCFRAWIRALVPEVYSPEAGCYHYRSMALSNEATYLRGDLVQLKKYLYVIRALLARRYVAQKKTPPPLPVTDLLPMFGSEHGAKAALLGLIEVKTKIGELGVGKRIRALDDFIALELGTKYALGEVRDEEKVDRMMEELYASTVYGSRFPDPRDDPG
jgi:predicted nucleotidyltransferase